MPPEVIAGRYRVERQVGRGGMGAVWLCHDEFLGRAVAVKQVGTLADEPTPDRARALREARAAAALNHRNVVAVFDVVEEGDTPWLVMEYVPSRTLAQLLEEEGPLEPSRAARIGEQLARGLAAAHELGIVHRDVKPGNVLVTEDDTAKISDFGIARRNTDQRLTSSGLVTGTPAYFAPELARGAEATAASDVWALGVTLFLAVEGELPYRRQDNPLAVLQSIVAEPVPRPRRAGPLTEPISAMMDPDPQARTSMHVAAHSLRRVAEQQDRPEAPEDGATVPYGAGTARSAEGTGPVPGPGRTGRRGRRAALVAVALAVLLVTGAVGYLLSTGGGSPSASPASDPVDPASTQPSTSPSATRGHETQSASPDQERPADGHSEGHAKEKPKKPGPGKEKPKKPGPDKPKPKPDGKKKHQPNPAPSGSPVGFVDGYFATMPDGTDSGWTMLSPAMQRRVGRGDYESFWGSIDAVEASGTTLVSGGGAVRTTLTYHFDDGRVVRERQRLALVQRGGHYRIDRDTVLSSRTVRS